MLAGQRLVQGRDHFGYSRGGPDQGTRNGIASRRRLSVCSRRCLEKDPKQRLRDIGDARFLLADDPPQTIPARKSSLPWKISAGALAIVSVIALVFLWISTHHATPPVMRLSVGPSGKMRRFHPSAERRWPCLPDGLRIVFVIGQRIVKSQLAVRRLDQPKAAVLAGTDGAEAPFFSPDGKYVGFFADGKLKKIDADGGAPVTLCDAPSQREGSWGEDDNIVFAAVNDGGLWRVPASGGAPQEVTKVEQQREYSHRYPQVLPGAAAVLFTNSPSDAAGEGSIEVQSLKTGERKTLVQPGGYGRYLPSGHLVYLHRGALFMRANGCQPPDTYRTGRAGAGEHQFLSRDRDGCVHVLAVWSVRLCRHQPRRSDAADRADR